MAFCVYRRSSEDARRATRSRIQLLGYIAMAQKSSLRFSLHRLLPLAALALSCAFLSACADDDETPAAKHPCDELVCGENERCDYAAEACVCEIGWVREDDACSKLAACTQDEDCDDGIACNGFEICDQERGVCEPARSTPCGPAHSAYCEIFDEPNSYQCSCAPGFAPNASGGCDAIASCEVDTDCDDGVFCNGVERCGSNGRCVISGTAFEGIHACAGAHEICDEELRACVCEPGAIAVEGGCAPDPCYGRPAAECQLAQGDCPLPRIPTLTFLHRGAVLPLHAPHGFLVEVATLADHQTHADAVWAPATSFDLSAIEENTLRLLARTQASDDQECEHATIFDWTYQLVDSYPGAPGQHHVFPEAYQPVPSHGLDTHGDPSAREPVNPRIQAWARLWSDVLWGANVDYVWRRPWLALGVADGVTTAASLGNGGRLTMTFDPPIADGEGPDFAVYENGFLASGGGSTVYVELGFVEVSSDGVHFVRFDAHALPHEPPGAYGQLAPELFHNLAGNQPLYWGSAFDLRELVYRDEVMHGVLDLGRITHVRLVDVVGDGRSTDAFGTPLFDAHQTWGSGGFDLDAIGVLNEASETR